VTFDRRGIHKQHLNDFVSLTEEVAGNAPGAAGDAQPR
jgi:hypothetical protein